MDVTQELKQAVCWNISFFFFCPKPGSPYHWFDYVIGRKDVI